MTQPKKRGGNYGGGPLVRRVVLSAAAAQIVRNDCTLSDGNRQTAQAAGEAASRLIELSGRLVAENQELRARLDTLTPAQ